MKLRFACPAAMMLVALLAATSQAPAATGTPALVPANDAAIVYEGRFAADASGAVRLGFPGVTVHLRFRGTALSLRLRAANDDLYFDVSVDDTAPVLLRLHGGEGDYPLVRSDRAGEHTVTVLRRNESWQGTCTLLGFDPGPGGALLPPPALPGRRLMFIGDSVTCGEMTAYEPGRDMHDKANSSAGLSYGMLLARRLGAQCHLVSYGGRGVIRDWQGIRDTRNAPQFYELALPDEPATAWDHARYVPDAIGLELGTNDFSPGIPDQNEFVNAYVEFVRKLRRDAPGARIFLLDSPIVDDSPTRGPRRAVLHAYLEQVVARVDQPLVRLAPVSHYAGVPGNGHPSRQEHVAMADELEPVFRQALGW